MMSLTLPILVAMHLPTRLSDLTRTEVARARLVDFARWVSVTATRTIGDAPSEDIFAARWPRSPNVHLIREWPLTKAAVPAGSGASGSWASALLTPAELGREFVAFNRPATLLGRLDAARRVPLRTLVPTFTTGMSTFAWVGSGRPKPLSSAVLDRTSLFPTIASGNFVITTDLLRLSTPGSEQALLRDMSAGLAAFLDEQFIDPTVAAVSEVSPGSITNGVTAAASSSGDPVTDFRELAKVYVADGGELTNAVIILSSQNAVALALRSGGSTEPIFAGLHVTGGTIMGLPALASEAAGEQLVMVDASRVLVADEDGIDVRQSREASIEMSDAPTQNASTPTSAALVSMFQSDSTAFRVERYISWERTGAIARIEGVNYLSEGGSP